MGATRKNPLALPATCSLVVAAGAWFVLLLLAAAGVVNLPWWAVVFAPSVFLVAAFLGWCAWIFLLGFFHDLRARFVERRR